MYIFRFSLINPSELDCAVPSGTQPSSRLIVSQAFRPGLSSAYASYGPAAVAGPVSSCHDGPVISFLRGWASGLAPLKIPRSPPQPRSGRGPRPRLGMTNPNSAAFDRSHLPIEATNLSF